MTFCTSSKDRCATTSLLVGFDEHDGVAAHDENPFIEPQHVPAITDEREARAKLLRERLEKRTEKFAGAQLAICLGWLREERSTGSTFRT
jgi:hypothetical protein